MPQWFVPYTAAALVAAALGWLAFSYEPDPPSQPANPRLAGAPAPAQGQPTASARGGAANPAAPAPPAAAPDPAPAPAPSPAAGPEAAVRQVVTAALTTDRPADCGRYYTLAFHEQLHAESGPGAMEECREDADGDPDGNRVIIRRLDPGPAGYVVAAVLDGGKLGRASFTMTVVQAAGTWKIDRLAAFDIEMGRMAALFREEAMEEEGYSASEATCLANVMASIGEDRFERAFLEGRADDVKGELAQESLKCLSAATLREQFAHGVRRSAGSEIPRPILECIIDRIVTGQSAAELRAMIRRGPEAAERLGATAAQECAASAGLVS